MCRLMKSIGFNVGELVGYNAVAIQQEFFCLNFFTVIHCLKIPVSFFYTINVWQTYNTQRSFI